MIMCQLIMIHNDTRRPFRHDVFDSGFETMEEANAKQRFRRSLGNKFVNGWHVVHSPEWTEYQRYYEVQE